VDGRGRCVEARIEGRAYRLDLTMRPDGTYVALFDDGAVRRVRVFAGDRYTRLRFHGADVGLELFDPRHAGSAPAGAVGTSEIVAAMPGRVVEVGVQPGQEIKAGDVLLILEAMKMQNEIRAEADAVVREVACRPGDAVEAGAVLVRF
jgi:acetyl/propionyl-CoA carboxylase alpha subunit